MYSKQKWLSEWDMSSRSVCQLKSVTLLIYFLRRARLARPWELECDVQYSTLNVAAKRRNNDESNRQSLRPCATWIEGEDGNSSSFTYRDCWTTEESAPWRTWFQAELSRLGIPVIDLLPDFSKLSIAELDRMFIQHDIKNYVGAKGHYSVAGNEYVAKIVYDRLTSLAAFRE
jgi:hypothetical protein